MRDAAAAEDIAQEAFLSALSALGPLRPPPPVCPLAAPDRRQPGDRLEPGPLAARRGGGERSAARLGRCGAGGGRAPWGASEIADALAALSAEHRAVVVLRYLLDYTPGEIARMLDLPRGTINSRLRRALDRLSELLDEEGAR